ncbi:thiamine phosphate synthase [Sphingosinicella ginsenosidimutans]|nr:thiamine phosphate synthase [Sphingosinicella ginsenosidimutans]
MPAFQPLPRRWMMTDERMGDGLPAALDRLPAGSGIVFRHYRLGEAERRALFETVRARACRRGQLLLLAGPAETARLWGADGSHGRGPGEGLRTAPAHDLAELRQAEAAAAALVFLSPVFATRSHAGARPIGVDGFATLAAATSLPVVALGGMNEARGAELMARGAYGWAGIDAWLDRSGDQKWKAVPI